MVRCAVAERVGVWRVVAYRGKVTRCGGAGARCRGRPGVRARVRGKKSPASVVCYSLTLTRCDLDLYPRPIDR